MSERMVGTLLVAGPRGPVEVPSYTLVYDGLAVCESPTPGESFMLAHVWDETSPAVWALPPAWLPLLKGVTVLRLTRLRSYMSRSAKWAWNVDGVPIFNLTPEHVTAYFRGSSSARHDMRRNVERALKMGYGRLPELDDMLRLVVPPVPTEGEKPL